MGLNSQTENYCPDEIFDVELYDIDGSQLFNDGDNTPMTIGVIGADSDEAIKARRGATNRRIQAGARAKVTAEGLETQDNNYLATLTKRWNITMDGVKPECTKAAALAIYANPKLAFIKEQVDAAIGERSNFFEALADELIEFASAVYQKGRKEDPPPLPDELSGIWTLYQSAARRRQVGMGANPLSDLELEAFCRRSLVDLSAWEKDLIMRLDDAVLAAVSGSAPSAPAKTSTGEPAPPTEASASDTASVKAIFRGIAARKAKAPTQA